MTDLLAQLRTARHDLIAQIAAGMNPDQHLPDAGFLALLNDIQGAITAVEEDTASSEEAGAP